MHAKQGSIDRLYQDLNRYKEVLCNIQKEMSYIIGDISRLCYKCKLYLGDKHNIELACCGRLNFIFHKHHKKSYNNDNEELIKYNLINKFPECKKLIDIKVFKTNLFYYTCFYISKNKQKAVCSSRL